MKLNIFQLLIFSFLGALTLIGCQQPGQVNGSGALTALNAAPVKDQNSTNSDSTSTEGMSRNTDGGYDEDENEDYTEVDDDTTSRSKCANSFSKGDAVDLTATLNLKIADVSGNRKVDTAINKLIVQNVSGNTKIRSAIDASVTDVSGNLSLRAQRILNLSDVSGRICIKAKSIERFEGGSGYAHLIADEITLLTSVSGNLHVYGGVIKKARALSGNICLHNGARVLEIEEQSGKVKTDCK